MVAARFRGRTREPGPVPSRPTSSTDTRLLELEGTRLGVPIWAVAGARRKPRLRTWRRTRTLREAHGPWLSRGGGSRRVMRCCNRTGGSVRTGTHRRYHGETEQNASGRQSNRWDAYDRDGNRDGRSGARRGTVPRAGQDRREVILVQPSPLAVNSFLVHVATGRGSFQDERPVVIDDAYLHRAGSR
jgi:hypothetical protein